MWWYLFAFMAGIITGMVVYLKIDGPDMVINDNTRIGKMKQRGQGNVADVTVDPQLQDPMTEYETPESAREARLLARIRKLRSRELKDKKESG
jgi:hypothetical protein